MTGKVVRNEEEMTHLKERAGKMAREKSYLQLIIDLVNKHGGHIDAECMAGKGSVFTISLPIAKDMGSPEEQE